MVGPHLSTALCLSTGAPQGCVLSPLLYTQYTYSNASTYPGKVIVRFAEVGLIFRHHTGLKSRGWWGGVLKTLWTSTLQKPKEVIVEYRSRKPVLQSIEIKGEVVERVPSSKFLGIARRCRPPKDHQHFGGCEEGPTTTPLSKDPRVKDGPAGSILPLFY